MRAPFRGCSAPNFCAQGHQARHLGFGDRDLLAAEIGQADVGDHVGRRGLPAQAAVGRCHHGLFPENSSLPAGRAWVGNICGDAEASGSRRRESTGILKLSRAQAPCHARPGPGCDLAATRALGRALAPAAGCPGTDPAAAGGAGGRQDLPGAGPGRRARHQRADHQPHLRPGAALRRPLAEAGATALVHLDLYRLEQPAAADELFAQEEEEARALGALLAVEWPERLSQLPAEAWRLQLELADPADPEQGRIARLIAP